MTNTSVADNPTGSGSFRSALLCSALAGLSACAGIHDPTDERSPEFARPTWMELRDDPSYRVSERLARVLDEEGVPTTLRVTGELFYVSTSLDENGAGRIESLLALRGRADDRIVRRISRLNDLVYDDKDYRFLRASIAYWRVREDAPGTFAPGVHLMTASQADAARRGKLGVDFVRAEPAMSWQEIQPIKSPKELLADLGVDQKAIVANVMVKRSGAVKAYYEENTATRFDLIFELPLDLLREVADDGATVFADVSLGQGFRSRAEHCAPAVTLRGTLGIRNPVVDGKPAIDRSQRPHRTDRIYANSLTAEDVRALMKSRRRLLQNLEDVLSASGDAAPTSEAWKKSVRQLGRFHANAASLLLEAKPTELATVMPNMAKLERAKAHKVLPNGVARVLQLDGERFLDVHTGDVALRLGSSRQIAVGTFPLPAVRERDANGFVTEMDAPGAGNPFTIFRMSFAAPPAQPLVKQTLADLWEHVPESLRAAVDSPPQDPREHPFFTDPAANPAFLTVLDRYIGKQIEDETVATRVGDEWTTEVIEGQEPEVIAPEDSPGELTWFRPEDVHAMRGRDIQDIRDAVSKRGDALPSPFDLDMTDADALANNMPYWPGTPFLSHAGMIVVEEVEGRPRAFVYDAYPGEGLRRKTMKEFFGSPEGIAGAIFRVRDTELQGDLAVAPGRAAREVVELYSKRRARKLEHFGKAATADAATFELLGAEEAAPPNYRAQAWDSFDYAFDWRNQVRYACSELVWAHYARSGVQLCDSFSMLLAPVSVAQDKLGWNVEVLIQASPQALILADKLWRVADFDSASVDAQLEQYDDTGAVQQVTAGESGIHVFTN